MIRKPSSWLVVASAAVLSSVLACGDAGATSAGDGGDGGGGGVVLDGGVGSFGSFGGEGGGGADAANGDGCSDSAKLIYVVSNDDLSLYSFYPPTLTFTKVGPLSCDPASAPFAMSVARDGTAWVLYQSGQLYKVSTKDASCTPTAFVPGQSGFSVFGMGFSADVAGQASETLYVCWTQGLAKIDTATLTLTPIGTLPGITLTSGCDLTGTGNAELYSFIPQASEWLIARLDKATSAPTFQKSLTPPIPAGGSWGTSFWGGDLYLYTTSGGSGSSVWRFRPSDGTTVLMKDNIGFSIVGAGESTCAPTSGVK